MKLLGNVLWGLIVMPVLWANEAELNDRTFLRDALNDAKQHFAEISIRPGVSETFDVYRNLNVDLNGDGVKEVVIAGTILNRDLNYVMTYYQTQGVWKHEILNRSLGGSIMDLKVIDIDQDGKQEIYTVVQDKNLMQSCRIYEFWADDEKHFLELFKFDSKGGLSNSCNILLSRPSQDSSYRIRIDEVEYPEDDSGEVKQRTSFYKLVLQNFVLERSYSGRN